MQHKANIVVVDCFHYNKVGFSCGKGGRTAFRDFLKSEFCEENLDFWLACQEFKTLDSPQELAKRAACIYEEFIRAESPTQVKHTPNTNTNINIIKCHIIWFAHKHINQMFITSLRT